MLLKTGPVDDEAREVQEDPWAAEKGAWDAKSGKLAGAGGGSEV